METACQHDLGGRFLTTLARFGQPPHPAHPGWRKRRLWSTLSPKGARVVNSSRLFQLPPPSPPWGKGDRRCAAIPSTLPKSGLYRDADGHGHPVACRWFKFPGSCKLLPLALVCEGRYWASSCACRESAAAQLIPATNRATARWSFMCSSAGFGYGVR